MRRTRSRSRSNRQTCFLSIPFMFMNSCDESWGCTQQAIRRLIALHDTTTFGDQGEWDSHRGLWPAVVEFLDANPEWWLGKVSP